MTRRPAIFLDRDGTLMEDREYLREPSGVRVFPQAAESLSRLRSAGFALIVITNQSGIGRGWMTEADYQAVTAEFLRQLGETAVDAIYHCAAAPARAGEDEHPDRKPAPGMYLRAAREWNIDLGASWAIGDSPRDLIAGYRAGCEKGILVRTGKPVTNVADDWIVVADIAEAADVILGKR